MNNTESENVDCESTADLQRYLSGELSADEEQSINGHVEGCDRCRAVLDALSSEGETPIDRMKNAAGYLPVFQTGLGKKFGTALDFPQPRLPAGFCIGDYRIVSLLGRGRMGDVYRATQMSCKRFVAFKVMRNSHVADHSTWSQFQEHVLAVRKLHHAHLVKVYEVNRIDDMTYLSMEPVNGHSAAAVVNSVGVLKLADACEIIRQTAVGMTYSHSQGFGHGQLKLSDLLIDSDGTVRITGLAQYPLVSTTTQRTLAANQLYVQSDVHAIGGLLYKLLTGQPWFGFGTPQKSGRDTEQRSELFAAMTAAGLPRDLNRLVSSLLVDSTDSPYVNAESLTSSLRSWSANADLRELLALV